MAKSIVDRRRTSRSTRASSKRPSTRRRHHHGSVLVEDPPLPDITELRRLRRAYFDGSTASKSTRSASSRKQVVKDIAGKSQNSTTVKTTRKTRPRDRTSEYVYATAAATDDEELRRGHTRRRSKGSQDAEGLSTIPETEVTPDDSVSQIGSRRRRTRKMPTTLRTVAEKVDPPQSSTRSKRDSLFGSIFSRRTSVATNADLLVECLTCGADDIPASKSAKLACDHRMCHSCLKRLFKLAVQDPAHMPPRCCTDQAIPLKHVDKVFDTRFKLIYNRKLDEFQTKNRVYCPNRRCGMWIRPAYYHNSGGRKYAQCRRCSTRACLHCGMKLHKSRECPKDPEIAKLTAQAEEQGWKRCYSCKAMVELREGCNHMTCRCTAEFCMVCGSKWKTCDCPWFSAGAIPVLNGDEGAMDPFAFLHRHIFGQPADAAPAVRTYRQEMDQRRRQEQVDEDLAHRMQFMNFWE